MRPVIGISADYDYKNKKYTLNDNYIKAITDAGGIPIIIPSHEKPEQFLKIVDGIILSGGAIPDLDTSKKMWPPLKRQDKERYSFGEKILRTAYKKNIPVIGICRGFQMITDVFGGHVNNTNRKFLKKTKDTINHNQSKPGNITVHSIHIRKDSELYESVKMITLMVNSFHRQTVDKGSSRLIITAKSPDGIIEAIEVKDRPIYGYQFHPEKCQDQKVFRRIFSRFVKKCKK